MRLRLSLFVGEQDNALLVITEQYSTALPSGELAGLVRGSPLDLVEVGRDRDDRLRDRLDTRSQSGRGHAS